MGFISGEQSNKNDLVKTKMKHNFKEYWNF